MELPTKPSGPLRQDPKNLIIFSKPKCGKSSLIATLPDLLLVDTEDGSDYITAMKVKVNSIDDIKNLGEAIKSAKYPYKYVAIDTITSLETICIAYAEQLYAASPIGSTWFSQGKEKYGSFLNLPNGSAYAWIRTAYEKAMNYISTWAPNIIQLGHVKDTILEKNSKEFSSMDLDLTGKLKRIASSNSDAIGYLYRKKNQNILSFLTSDEVSCGARSKHLSNKEIILSEMNENEELITYWDKIYLDK